MVMKRYPHSAIVLLAALAFAGCSKTEELQYNSDSALQIESVSGISPFDLMQNQASKAVITGDSLPGDEAAKGIGLFVTAANGGAYDGHDSGYTNVKYTFDGSKWSTQSPIYLSSNEGNLYGYFPYSGTANDLRAIPVESSLNGTDYLYAKSQTVSHSYKSVSLQMNHALSRLHLTIKKGENFTADASLSKITLKSTAIDATGTMDLTTGVITASKKSGETGIVELATDGEITAGGIEKDILLVPADNSEGKKDIAIILAIGNKLASVTLTETGGIDIRSGIQNNVTLTIEDTGIKVTGVDVGVWGEGGSQEVQVSGHTVTVKLSEDTGIADDVLTNVKVDGENVIIKAYSESGQHLKCSLGEGVFSPLNKTSNLVYSFTISNIASDITATIGYAKPVTVNVSSNSAACGTAKFVGDCYEGEQVTFTATTKNEYSKFIGWQDADGKTLSTENPYNVALHSSISVKAVFELPEGVIDINGHLAVNLGGIYWGIENVGVVEGLQLYNDNVYGALYTNRVDIHVEFYQAPVVAESWGANDNYRWTLPSMDQFNNLARDCYWEWKDNYNGSGMNGYIIYKAKNDVDKGKVGGIEGYSTDADIYIFLPAAGYTDFQEGIYYRHYKGSRCYYWNQKTVGIYFYENGSWNSTDSTDQFLMMYGPIRLVAVPI